MCQDAVDKWKLNKGDLKFVKKIINPTHAFKFQGIKGLKDNPNCLMLTLVLTNQANLF